MGHNASNLLYLVTIVTFIWALRDLSNPARLGQASSDTYALPPRARAGGRGAWSC